MRAKDVGLMIKLAGAVGLPLIVVLLLVGRSTGMLLLPPAICKAVTGLCTPMPMATATSTRTPTQTPIVMLTATPTPIPTMTPTPTPLLCAAVLASCMYDDFDFEVQQLSPVTQTVTRRTAGEAEGLQTRFVITNTGNCRLLGGVVLGMDPDNLSASQIVATLPPLLEQGRRTQLTYTWPPLSAGEHSVRLTLQFKNAQCKDYNIPDREFPLAVNLTVVLDRDDDTIPDARDACPDAAGTAALQGCPDRDSDGIPDKVDCCPEHPGASAFKGCPDTDGDGFPERNDGTCPGLPPVDQCPNVCGKDPATPGCPMCQIVFDRCMRQVCVVPGPGQEPVCVDESYECNPHEVCETCP